MKNIIPGTMHSLSLSTKYALTSSFVVGRVYIILFLVVVVFVVVIGGDWKEDNIRELDASEKPYDLGGFGTLNKFTKLFSLFEYVELYCEDTTDIEPESPPRLTCKATWSYIFLTSSSIALDVALFLLLLSLLYFPVA